MGWREFLERNRKAFEIEHLLNIRQMLPLEDVTEATTIHSDNIRAVGIFICPAYLCLWPPNWQLFIYIVIFLTTT